MFINGVHYYKTCSDVMSDLDFKLIDRKTNIKFKINNSWVDTSVGRMIIMDATGIFIDYDLDKSGTKKLCTEISRVYNPEEASIILKKFQDVILEAVTNYGLSLCYSDFSKSSDYSDKLDNAYKETRSVDGDARAIIWDNTINSLVDDWKLNSVENPLHIMMKAGARVTDTQIRQMVVSKGLLTKMNGDLNVNAIQNSLGDGLDSGQYFMTCGPARRGLANNFFMVPASGYLERQLVNLCRDLTITTKSCDTTEGSVIKRSQSLGRYLLDGNLITKDLIKTLDEEVIVKSPLFCTHNEGLCSECVGLNPANSKEWHNNVGIGVIAAQSLSEPVTQLGLRGKHTSGSVTYKSYSKQIGNALADMIKLMGAQGTTDIKVSASEMPSPSNIEGSNYFEKSHNLMKLIHELYLSNGISLNRVYVEILIRSMSDLVYQDNTVVGLRSRGFTDSNPKINTTSTILRNNPSWLKNIEFGYVGSAFEKALNNCETSLGLPSERLLTGYFDYDK